MIEFDTIAFEFATLGVQTEEHSSGIRTGGDTRANFSGDDAIGIGVTGPPRTFMWPSSSMWVG